jgi:hypothetical protein
MYDDCTVRTTLEIDDDVLSAARELAAARQKSMGEIVSELARKGLESPLRHGRVRNGVPLLPHEPGRIVTVEMVEKLLDEP